MSQNKLEKSDLIKKRYIYNVRKKSGWEVPEIGHVFVDSIVFKKIGILFIFGDGGDGEVKEVVIF